MQDEPDVNTSHRRSATDRVRASRWLRRYKFPQLWQFSDGEHAPPPPPEPSLETRRWELRGQPRTRETFALPHPADFPGGLPLPAEYPRRIRS